MTSTRMGRRSREVLARHYRSLAQTPSCSGQGAAWTEAERRYELAQSAEQAAEIASSVLHQCHDCPALSLCEQWAKVDRYTGLAAGHAWRDGRRRLPGIRRSPDQTKKTA